MFEVSGIVIRFTPFRDNDAMVSVLCPDRIVSFLARGVLKYESKNAASLNLFSHSRFQISKGKDGYTLRSGELLFSNQELKDSLDKLATIDLIGEIISKMVINEDAAQVYPWLERCLYLIKNNFDTFSAVLKFLCAILTIIGFGMNLNSCASCGKQNNLNTFSLFDGGVLCNDCLLKSKNVIHKYNLDFIKNVFDYDITNYGKISYSKGECLNLLNDINIFLQNNLQINLKGIYFINKI